jgi:hypothetical protein
MRCTNLCERCPGPASRVNELALILADFTTLGRLLPGWLLRAASHANKGLEHDQKVSPTDGLEKGQGENARRIG